MNIVKRLKISELAKEWCDWHNIPPYPINIVTALDVSEFLVTRKPNLFTVIASCIIIFLCGVGFGYFWAVKAYGIF